ncbi:hypothetical protein [Pseudomonas sp. SID14000]|uniref:capsid assembly protein n=1 Tax=Pseudomonas sp. SID14000 TaxID=1986221 RepID=UPI001C476B83|nr:hypothetical protein [Pseudomonas sp. SID14000]
MRIGILSLSMATLAGALYRSADVYASFGVNNAIISSSDPAEHEQNMLKLDVSVRDGDDEITLDQVTGEEAPKDKPEGEEGGEQDADKEAGEEDQDGPKDDQELELLDEPSDELKQSIQGLDEYAEGFDTLRQQAIKNGLTEEAAANAEVEYERDGKLSDATYEALAKAGYSKSFVDSFIRGQEALADKYAAAIVSYAGGQDKFNAIVSHMRANSPESLAALEAAMERKDLVTVRSIINLGVQSRAKKLGKAPERNVMAKAPASPQGTQKAPKVEPFGSRKEMIDAMNSKEYRLDEAFRRQVEARLLASPF